MFAPILDACTEVLANSATNLLVVTLSAAQGYYVKEKWSSYRGKRHVKVRNVGGGSRARKKSAKSVKEKELLSICLMLMILFMQELP